MRLAVVGDVHHACWGNFYCDRKYVRLAVAPSVGGGVHHACWWNFHGDRK